jgi:hypothetical protein
MISGGIGIDLGNDEGHNFVHSEGGGVVDDDASCLCRDGAVFKGNSSSGREESNVDAREAVGG